VGPQVFVRLPCCDHKVDPSPSTRLQEKSAFITRLGPYVHTDQPPHQSIMEVMDDGSIALLLLLLLLFPVLLAIYLRRRRVAPAAASANHCPHPNRVLGNAVPLLRNLHRFLDWATDQLAESPASTIEVRGPLGLGGGVATASPEAVDHLLRANFPNYVKGARFAVPFADLLGRGIFLADGRLWKSGASSASSPPTPSPPARCAASRGGCSGSTSTAASSRSSTTPRAPASPLTCRTCSGAAPSTTSVAWHSASRAPLCSSSRQGIAAAGGTRRSSQRSTTPSRSPSRGYSTRRPWCGRR
uniref:Cytochrome P450 n=1 Tax=Aegilops tauschii subsp. strangulata TaxID=200361 RepID=A0A453GNR7_AEGTS